MSRPVWKIFTCLMVSAFPALGEAQTVVKTTLGPNDAYFVGASFAVRPGLSLAQQFSYAGPVAQLDKVRLVLGGSPLLSFDISFLAGSNISTAATLAAWNVTGVNYGMNTFSSEPGVLLSTGGTYWVKVEVPEGEGIWGISYGSYAFRSAPDQDTQILGTIPENIGRSTTFNFGQWFDLPCCLPQDLADYFGASSFTHVSAAYEVSVSPVIIPEPSTYPLIGSGLVGLIIVACRRRRSQAMQSLQS